MTLLASDLRFAAFSLAFAFFAMACAPLLPRRRQQQCRERFVPGLLRAPQASALGTSFGRPGLPRATRIFRANFSQGRRGSHAPSHYPDHLAVWRWRWRLLRLSPSVLWRRRARHRRRARSRPAVRSGLRLAARLVLTSAAQLLAVIGMAREDLLRAVDLLQKHRAGQEMRPGHRAQGQFRLRLL